MDKLKFESFYIFLATLGVLLIIGPLTVLCAFINNDVQLISQSDFEGLSGYSQTALNSKQLLVADMTKNYFSLILLPMIIGVILIIYASYKWRQNQKELDEQERLRTELKRLEVQEKMSDEEIAAKAISKIIIDNKDNERVKGKFMHGNEIQKSVMQDDMCFDYIEAIYKKNFNYKFIRRMKIGLCKYDLIAKNNEDLGDILFEVRFEITDTSMLNREIDELRMSRTYYCESTGRKAMGYVVIVVDADGKEFDALSKKILSVNQPADVRLKVFKMNDLMDYQNKNRNS